jgi:hypothetical protein
MDDDDDDDAINDLDAHVPADASSEEERDLSYSTFE